MPPPVKGTVSPAAARAVLAEIRSIANAEASEYLPINRDAFARLVLYRLIRELDARLPKAEQGQRVELFW